MFIIIILKFFPIMESSGIDVLNEKQVIGSTLKNKYKITKFIDSGSNGQVYCVSDLSNPSASLVVKMTKQV